jgi:hypothetical protein
VCATFYHNSFQASGSGTLILDSTLTNEGGVFTLASNEVTVSEDGFYDISYGATIANSAFGGITNLLIALEKDTGSGFSSVTGTEAGAAAPSNRNAKNVILELQASDKIRINKSSTGSTVYHFLTIKKI